MPYDPKQYFFREPKLIWLADRETESEESALRFFVVMEAVYPAPKPPNTIIKVEGVVPVQDRYDAQKVRAAVMRAYGTLAHIYSTVNY